MRILVLTLMMSFLSHSAFGAAEGGEAKDRYSIKIIVNAKTKQIPVFQLGISPNIPQVITANIKLPRPNPINLIFHT